MSVHAGIKTLRILQEEKHRHGAVSDCDCTFRKSPLPNTQAFEKNKNAEKRSEGGKWGITSPRPQLIV